MDTLAVHHPPVGTSFRAAMRRIASTVTIITASDGHRRHGMTMTAVSSLSMEPPSMIICVNQSTFLHDILMSARHFCVNVLTHDQAEVSKAFSGASSPEERFSVGEWLTHGSGTHYLSNAQANIVCRKHAAIPFGTHTIFIGSADDVMLGDDARPLLYRNAAYC
ncbi:resorcinol 4-hydroxylase reductase subunit [Trinickia symbiotica]|nr:flavin reductase family protein [Trinickia symbiotica]PPK43051.1 resorcinol 4-hydroxylase reductase subunit [Trinickia symbiotica]